MKTQTLSLSLSALVLAASAFPLGAQTAPPAPAPVHHTTTTTMHHATTTPACVKLPELSPKIPALPAGLPCARPLYTITHFPDTHLDYASPLISPEVRETLSSEKTTYSLAYVDTVIGTGPVALPGKYYTVHYTGYLANGTKFDSSVDRGEPITFPYGQHRVIPGWDTGFEGMRVGGKRRLYIPYQLAYGEAGRPPAIPARAQLVFDVEFISQSDDAPKPKTPPMPPHHLQPNPARMAPGSGLPGAAPAAPGAGTTAPATKPATPPAGTTAPATPPTSTTTPPTSSQPQQH